MQKITFISLYDEFCLEARYVSAMLKHDGHETNIVFFKGLHYLQTDRMSTSPVNTIPVDDAYHGAIGFASPKETALLLKIVERQNPDLIIFYFSSPGFGLARFLTEKIKQQFSSPVLWIGPDTFFSPEENIRYADMIGLGEPEHPVRHVVSAMERKEDYSALEGIWLNRGGQIIRNPMLHLESNPDRFPWPDFEREGKSVIVNDELSYIPFPTDSSLFSNVIIRATRGNPFTCPYCQKAHDGVSHGDYDALRVRSADSVIDELKYRIRTWPTTVERIEFHDEFFPLERSWVEHFISRYSTEIALPFYAYTRPGFYDPEVFHRLRDAQMQALIIRLPSGSLAVQKNYFHRNDTKEEIIRMARMVLDSGMKALFEFIVHNPLENDEDRKETLDLICDLPKGVVLTKGVPMAFYSNCVLHQEAIAKGVNTNIVQPEGCHAFESVVSNDFVFWESLYTLAHFEGMEKETVLDFIRDEYMRKNPEILKEMADNLYKCQYLDGNPLANKEEYIHQLRWRITQSENDAAVFLVRHARKLAGLLKNSG